MMAGRGFDDQINRTACAYFARRGDDAPVAPLKAALKRAIAAAPAADSRTTVPRYLSDEYLDARIEKARVYIAEAPNRSPNRADTCFDDEDELIAAINERTAVVLHGDKLQILLEGDGIVRFVSVADARNALAPYKLRVEMQDNRGRPKTKLLPGFERWLQSSERREFKAKVFDPGRNAGPDVYNTYTGFGLTPAPGEWSLMQQHLFENVCRGSLPVYRVVLGWFAQLFQEPERKVGSALVLRGVKGYGKSIVADWLRRIVGKRHARKVANPRHLTGNFNAHFDGTLLAVLEEGFFAGDYTAESVIKDFVTGDTLMIESKGQNAQEVANFTRLLITSNAERVVPATEGERRFLMLNVGSRRARDTEFFGALDAQMRAGGAEAMLHDLLHFEWDEAALRNPPRTAALVDQIIEGLRPDERWLYSWLSEGFLPGDEGEGDEWEADRCLQVAINRVQDSYNAFVPQFRGGEATPTQIGRFMRRMVPDLRQARPGGRGGSRDRVYVLPPLEQARASFLVRFGISFGETAGQSDELRFCDCLEAREMFSASRSLPVELAASANDSFLPARAA